MAARAARQLRGVAALAHRPRGARPALVPGQPAACGRAARRAACIGSRRLHLLTGIGSYLTAPLWLLFLLTGILISLQARFVRPEYFPQTSLFPQWPAIDPVRALWIFVGTMALLLVPKLLRLSRDAAGPRDAAWLWRGLARLPRHADRDRDLRPDRAGGDADPVASRAAILRGRDTGWNAQRRDDGSLPLRATMRRYGWHTVFGLLLALAAYEVSYSLFAWMTPVIAGLILAIPLAQWTANPAAGLRMRARNCCSRRRKAMRPRSCSAPMRSPPNWRSSDPRGALERLVAILRCSPRIAPCCRRLGHARPAMSTSPAWLGLPSLRTAPRCVRPRPY